MNNKSILALAISISTLSLNVTANTDVNESATTKSLIKQYVISIDECLAHNTSQCESLTSALFTSSKNNSIIKSENTKRRAVENIDNIDVEIIKSSISINQAEHNACNEAVSIHVTTDVSHKFIDKENQYVDGDSLSSKFIVAIPPYYKYDGTTKIQLTSRLHLRVQAIPSHTNNPSGNKSDCDEK